MTMVTATFYFRVSVLEGDTVRSVEQHARIWIDRGRIKQRDAGLQAAEKVLGYWERRKGEVGCLEAFIADYQINGMWYRVDLSHKFLPEQVRHETLNTGCISI